MKVLSGQGGAIPPRPAHSPLVKSTSLPTSTKPQPPERW